MDKQRVIEALDTLHAELDAAEVGPEARNALLRVTAAIREHVAGERSADAEELGPHADAAGLRDSLLGIEAEHPRLTSALNRVAEALANLGI